MPIINLPVKKTWTDYKRTESSKGDNLIHILVYDTPRWRKMRKQYLVDNPLCEICKQNKKLTLAIEVHHKKPISLGSTNEEKEELGFDYKNLQALCVSCHKDVHIEFKYKSVEW
jgi:5-methylcytosine-specific restriction protein A